MRKLILLSLISYQVAAQAPKKISDYPAAVTINGTEETLLNQGGVNRKATVNQILGAGLFVPLSFKTGLDALNGIIKSNGAGVYSVITDNSSDWNANTTWRLTHGDNAVTAFGWGNHAGLYRPISYVPTWASITGKLAKNGVYLDGDTLKLGGQLSGATFYNPSDSSDYIYINPETGDFGSENPTNDVSIFFGGSVNGVIGMSKISNGDLWFYALENSTTVAQSLVIRDNQAAGYNSIISYDPIGLTDSELRIQSSFNVFNSAIQVGSLGGSTINGRFGYNGSNYVGRRSGTNYDFPLTLNGNTANRMPVWQANSILGQTPYTVPTVNGSNGQVLTTNGSGAATWQTPSSGFSDPMTTRGDIIIRNASNTTARLGVGANTYVLTSDGTDVSWAAPSGGGATNLSFTGSATNGTVNSDTGTDATIPLGNGTNSGLSLNDYTTAEKSKLAGISGTNTGDVSLAGTPDYITISGQTITRGLVDLATDITGDLPFANLTQGSALSVLGVTGNATADVASIAAGTDGHVLRRAGTALAFGTLASGAFASNTISRAALVNGSSLSVIGRSANSSGAVADIAAAADGDVLRRSGTTLGFGTIVSAGIADGTIANVDINASAAIDATKLIDGSITNTELGYINTLTSNAQTQITARELLANKVTALTTMDNDKYPTTQSLFADRTVTGTDAIVQSDNGKTIYFNSASAMNFTIDQLTIRSQVSLVNIGSGEITFVNGTGVTIDGSTSLPGASGTVRPSGYISYRSATAPIIQTSGSGGLLSGGVGAASTSYSIKTLASSPMTASGSAYVAIPFATTFPNNTVVVVETTIVSMKSDGTDAAFATLTSMFRKDNSGTWTDDSPGTGTTSDASVIASLTGDIALSSQPVISIVYGAFSGTWTLGMSCKTTSHQY